VSFSVFPFILNTILPVVIGVLPFVTFACSFIVLPVCTSVFIVVIVSVGVGVVSVICSSWLLSDWYSLYPE